MSAAPIAAPGAGVLRPAPTGMPDIDSRPPTIAQTGDPFSVVRVVALVARLERGRPILLDDLAAALNLRYLDWAFSTAVVADVLVQLQANWMTDYRNASGIVVEDGPYGVAVTIEDSSRVDPWIVRQVERGLVACRQVLADFSRRDGAGFDD